MGRCFPDVWKTNSSLSTSSCSNHQLVRCDACRVVLVREELTTPHHHDRIAESQRFFYIGGGKHDRFARRSEFIDVPPKFKTSCDIDSARRFAEENDIDISDGETSQGSLLLIAAGKLADWLVAAAAFDAEAFDEFAGQGGNAAWRDQSETTGFGPIHDSDVFPDRTTHRQPGRPSLRNHADPTLAPARFGRRLRV